jgi:ABC-type nitrate/sulfonate/bicarbonate transport system substrate-binding protein
MGLNVLQYAIDVYGHYQGVVGAARRQWATDNAKTLTAYIRAYRAGVAFLHAPENKDEAIAILRKNLPQMSAELAADSHAIMTGPTGFSPDGAIDTAGIRRVLELRSEYGRPKKPLTDPARYYDPTYYDAVGR